FTSQTLDPSWSRDMALTLRNELIAAAPTGSTVLEAECAATLCRVVLKHESRSAQQGLARVVSDLAPFRAGVFYALDSEASPLRSTLYVLREGHDFNEMLAL